MDWIDWRKLLVLCLLMLAVYVFVVTAAGLCFQRHRHCVMGCSALVAGGAVAYARSRRGGSGG